MKPVNFDGIDPLQGLYHIASETSVSVIVEGDHGIGKSESVYAFASNNGFHVEPLFLSHQEVADLIGIPTLERDEFGTPLTTWSKPIWLHRMECAARDGKRCILFLDELNRAQPDVRQAALQLVLDKQIHEHHLPATRINGEWFQTFVIAAVNPANDHYQVDELDPALLDRFLHYKLQVNADRWLKWAVNKKIHPTIIQFISASKDKLYVRDENSPIFPTPRSWTKLSELLMVYEKLNCNNDTLLYDLIVGKIGVAVGVQFRTFYTNSVDLITVDDIIRISDNKYPEAVDLSLDTIESVEYVAREIYKTIKGLEIPLLRDLSDNMIAHYLGNEDPNIEFQQAIPLICFLHALPIEQLTVTVKGLQVEAEETNSKKYDLLAKISPGKALFHKIIKKIKKK